MTLSRVNDRIFLFGGSGPSAKCFSDLQIFEPAERRWVLVKRDPASEASDDDDTAAGAGRGAGAGARGRRWDGRGAGDGSGKEGDDDDGDVDMVGEGKSSMVSAGPRASVGSANPNEEDADATVRLVGPSPGRRAGHSATVVGREIIVFGGSCASMYWSDLYTLDTGER